jgi:hypothetical protein
MVRCEQYYEKCEELINLNVDDFIEFCMKDPETQRRIYNFVTKVRPLIQMVVEKSEILSEEKPPMGGILSERASRPLISEEDPEIAKMAAEKIVKIAEEKVLEGGKPRVTEREVSAIIEETKKEKSKKSKGRGTKKTRQMGYDKRVTIFSDDEIPLVIKGLEYLYENLNTPKSAKDVADVLGKDSRWFGLRTHLSIRERSKQGKRSYFYIPAEEELRYKLDVLRDPSKTNLIERPNLSKRFGSRSKEESKEDVKKEDRLAELKRNHQVTMDRLNTNHLLHLSVESYVKNGVLFCPVCGKGNGCELRWNCHPGPTLREMSDAILTQREAAIEDKRIKEASL